MRYVTAVVVLALAFVPVIASEPGQPLDCSDWVAVESGYSCSVYLATTTCDGWLNRWPGGNVEVDNEGRLLRIRPTGLDTPCGGATRTDVVVLQGGIETLIGYFSDRCISPITSGYIDSTENTTPCTSDEGVFKFDRIDGRLILPLISHGVNPPATVQWVAVINGFTSAAEIFQSFEPLQSALGFRVPAQPEGLPAADSFDTYHGNLATLPDWTQAQPLQCDYPQTSPSVGDYLTVADTLPDPAPGSGRYYVTAVHHQEETRFGRQFIGGALSGRNPETLPVCDWEPR